MASVWLSVSHKHDNTLASAARFKSNSLWLSFAPFIRWVVIYFGTSWTYNLARSLSSRIMKVQCLPIWFFIYHKTLGFVSHFDFNRFQSGSQSFIKVNGRELFPPWVLSLSSRMAKNCWDMLNLGFNGLLF